MNRYDIDKIKNVDIVDVAEILGIEMQKVNRSRVSILCPCHDDHHFGSCFIDTKKNSFYCFACHSGGTVIDLVMAARSVDFLTAVSEIAAMFGESEFTIDENAPIETHRKRDKETEDLCNLTDINRLYVVKNMSNTTPVDEDYDYDEDENGNRTYYISEVAMRHPLQDLCDNDPEGYNNLLFDMLEYTLKEYKELKIASRYYNEIVNKVISDRYTKLRRAYNIYNKKVNGSMTLEQKIQALVGDS